MKTLEEALAAIDELKAAHELEKAAILKKNSDLIAREKDAKKASDEAQARADDAADEAARKAGDLEALEKRLTEKHSKAIKSLEDQLAASTARLSGMLIDDTITKSLVDNNVPKHMHAPLAAMFKMNSKLVDGVAVFASDKGEVALTDHLPAYFKTDDGKAFVTAPVNVGTGSGGVKNPILTKRPETQEELVAFSNLSVTDPAAYQALAASWGLTN